MTTLRADAERNRAAIVAAASDVFGRLGTDAPFDEVARAAGVGVGTVYRRFPERDDLIVAVLEGKMCAYATFTASAAERALSEPWEAFAEFVTYILDAQTTDAAFASALFAPLSGSPLFAELHRDSFASMVTLIERAQAAGVLRRDFAHPDLYLMLMANAGLVAAARSQGPAASRRLGGYLLEAFRAPGHGELPPVPSVWKRASGR